jgi:hypothetical protein
MDDFQPSHRYQEKPLWAWVSAVSLIAFLTCISVDCHAGEAYIINFGDVYV